MKKIITLPNLIMLSIIGLPLYLVRLKFFGLPANILDILELTAIGWWISQKNKEFFCEKLRQKTKYFFPIALILAGIVVSALINGNYLQSAGVVKSWFVLPLLFSLAAADVFKNQKERILKVLYFSAFLTAFVALFYFFLGRLTYDGRLEAFFNSPNYLAMYLAPGLIIGLNLARIQNSKLKIKNSNLYYISYGIILISLYLTYSYAAWAAVILSLLLIEAIKKKFLILKSKLFWIALIIIGFTFFLQWNKGKFQNAFNVSERSSLASRVMIWKAAKKIIEDNFLWGIGLVNFQDKYLEYQKLFPPYLEWAVPHPHNTFLSFWLSAGLLGLVGFIWFIILWFKNVLAGNSDQLKFAFIAVMLYFLLHGLVDTTYFKNDLAVIFWLNFFLSLKSSASSGTRKDQNKS